MPDNAQTERRRRKMKAEKSPVGFDSVASAVFSISATQEAEARSRRASKSDKVRRVMFGDMGNSPSKEGQVPHRYEYIGPGALDIQLGLRVLFTIFLCAFSWILLSHMSACSVNLLAQLNLFASKVSNAAQMMDDGVLLPGRAMDLDFFNGFAEGMLEISDQETISKLYLNYTTIPRDAESPIMKRFPFHMQLLPVGVSFYERALTLWGSHNFSISGDPTTNLMPNAAGRRPSGENGTDRFQTWIMSNHSLWFKYLSTCSQCNDPQNDVYDLFKSALLRRPPYLLNCSSREQTRCAKECPYERCYLDCFERNAYYTSATTPAACTLERCGEFCAYTCRAEGYTYCSAFDYDIHRAFSEFPRRHVDKLINTTFGMSSATRIMWSRCAAWIPLTTYNTETRTSLMPLDVPQLVQKNRSDYGSDLSRFHNFVKKTLAELRSSCNLFDVHSSEANVLNEECKESRVWRNIAIYLLIAIFVYTCAMIIYNALVVAHWLKTYNSWFTLQDLMMFVALFALAFSCNPGGNIRLLVALSDPANDLGGDVYDGISSFEGNDFNSARGLWLQLHQLAITSYVISESLIFTFVTGMAIAFRNIHNAPLVEFCRSVDAKRSLVLLLIINIIYTGGRLALQLIYEVDVGIFPAAAIVSLFRLCTDYTEDVIDPTHMSCFDSEEIKTRVIVIITVIAANFFWMLFAIHEIRKTSQLLASVRYELSRSCHVGSRLLVSSWIFTNVIFFITCLVWANELSLFYSYMDGALCCKCIYQMGECNGMDYHSSSRQQFIYAPNLKMVGLGYDLSIVYVMQLAVFVHGWTYILIRKKPPPTSGSMGVVLLQTESEVQSLLPKKNMLNKASGGSILVDDYRWLLLPRVVAFDTIFTAFEFAFNIYGDLSEVVCEEKTDDDLSCCNEENAHGLLNHLQDPMACLDSSLAEESADKARLPKSKLSGASVIDAETPKVGVNAEPGLSSGRTEAHRSHRENSRTTHAVDIQRGGPAMAGYETICVYRVEDLHSVCWVLRGSDRVVVSAILNARLLRYSMKNNPISYLPQPTECTFILQIDCILGELPNDAFALIDHIESVPSLDVPPRSLKSAKQDFEKLEAAKLQMGLLAVDIRKAIRRRKTLRVHAGFIASFAAIHELLLPTIAEAARTRPGEPSLPVLCTGHSLGGALATVCALAVKLRLRLRSTLYTFGSPNVGNRAFRSVFRHAVRSSWRVVRDGDPITATPPFPYVPVGTLILLRRNGSIILNPNRLEARQGIKFSVSGAGNHLMAQYIAPLLGYKLRHAKFSDARDERVWLQRIVWPWFWTYIIERWQPDPEELGGALVRFKSSVTKLKEINETQKAATGGRGLATVDFGSPNLTIDTKACGAFDLDVAEI